MAEHALEWFIGTQSSRCSRDQRRLLFIWWAGVSTSPLQLLAYGGGGGGRGAPLKRFWVYVQEYGITLSSVLTAKHDSTANFWPEIKLQENDKKTNKQSARLLANWCSWCFRWREQSYSIIWLWEMVLRPCLPRFASLQLLQPSYPSKARGVTVNQDDNVLVCMPSANYWVNHSFSARGKKNAIN